MVVSAKEEKKPIGVYQDGRSVETILECFMNFKLKGLQFANQDIRNIQIRRTPKCNFILSYDTSHASQKELCNALQTCSALSSGTIAASLYGFAFEIVMRARAPMKGPRGSAYAVALSAATGECQTRMHKCSFAS